MAILFEKNFEDGNLEGWRINGLTPTVTSEILARVGTKCMKSHLLAGETRSEVRMPGLLNAVGNEYWYGFSVYLPEPFETNSAWEHVANWHGYPDFGIGEGYFGQGAPLQISTAHPQTAPGWSVRVRWDSKPNSTPGGVPDIEGQAFYEFGTYETDVWTDWVFHIKWEYDETGLLVIWKNGDKVLTRNGPNCYNDEFGPYFKMGIYRAGRSAGAARTIYHDEFKMADADSIYEDVAPGGKPPEPEPKPPVSRTANIIINIPATQVPVTITSENHD
ncbi:hypothetical protein LCGC14_0775730 [marine sediment metagenome]|uniref:Uncharacterized protein n=1 Tax=marine sediment metagenome TaxID=412755 RepID=A0A0F9T3Z5_9ZZZZ